MRKLTAGLIAFLLLVNAIIPTTAQANPVLIWLGEFLLSYAAGKVLDHVLDTVLSEGGTTGVPSEYMRVKEDCDRLRAVARETARALEDIRQRTEYLEERARFQDALYDQASSALRSINSSLNPNEQALAAFLTALPYRLDQIRASHDKAAAAQLGRELTQFRSAISNQNGLPSFLQQFVEFATDTTEAIKRIDLRQRREIRELRRLIDQHGDELRRVNWNLDSQKGRLEAHARRIEELEKAVFGLSEDFADHIVREGIARGSQFATAPIDVVEIQGSYSSGESIGFLLYLRDALAACGLPILDAPVFRGEPMHVRGTFSYAISCYDNPIGFRACDWALTLSKKGKRVHAQSEQILGRDSRTVGYLLQKHIARNVAEGRICERLK